jgi:hypothetical protein
MVRTRHSIRAVSLITGALALGACASGGGGTGSGGWTELAATTGASSPIVRITGTVRYLDLEGGLYVIADASGTRFSPTNLPREFRTDGLAVEAEARPRTDLVSIGMAGPLVELVRIRRTQ